jgi:hypothetical protein
MCEWGTTTPVWVKIAADLSATGKTAWRRKPVDSCIADLIGALQLGGIDMVSECCGHYRDMPSITLEDGRIIVVTDESFNRHWHWLAMAFGRAMRWEKRKWAARARHRCWNAG